MSSRLTLLRLSGLVMLVPLVGCSQPGPASCGLAKVGDFPVTYVSGHTPVIVVKLAGSDERMMVDTGSSNTFLTVSSYLKLGLVDSARITGYEQGLGGNMQVNNAQQEDMGLGTVTLKDQDLLISDFGVEKKNGQPIVDGLLGFDALQSFDVGLDLPDNDISLYLPMNCATTHTPWPGDYAVLPLVPLPNRLSEPTIPVQVDDKTLNALIDSGANQTLLLQKGLTSVVAQPEAIGHTYTGYGLGNKPFFYRREEFASLTIGAETFTDAWLDVSSRNIRYSNTFGTIGQDYLAHHRVFLANDTNTAYLGVTVP